MSTDQSQHLDPAPTGRPPAVPKGPGRPRRETGGNQRMPSGSGRFDSAIGWRGGFTPATVARAVAIVLIVAMFVIPFLTIISGAFDGKPSSTDVALIPREFSLRSFEAAIDRGMLHYVFNSFVILGGGLVLQLVFSIMVAYALSRFTFRGARLIFALFVLTMMLPEEIIAIPLVQVLGDLPLLGLNLRGTRLAVILPVAVWGFSVLLMTEFMRDIPKEVTEAATLDGAGPIKSLLYVVLPMCKPVLGVATIFGFIMIWDQYLLPLIAANTPDDYTITVALGVFRDDPNVGNGIVLVGALLALLALLPSLIAYLLLQRSLISGIAAGATKG